MKKIVPKITQSGEKNSFDYTMSSAHSNTRWLYGGSCTCGCFICLDRIGINSDSCKVHYITSCKTHKHLGFNSKLKGKFFKDVNAFEEPLKETHPQQYIIDAMNNIIDSYLSIDRHKFKDRLNDSLVKHLESM